MSDFKEYNILLCVSEEYFSRVLVVVLSAVKHLNKKINFYFMQNDWSNQTKNQCINFFKQLPPHTVTFLDVNEEELKSFKPYKGVYKFYYKLIAHQYLPDTVDRILYLDSDIMIRKDIENFYSLDFDDNYLIATNCRMETSPKWTYKSWVLMPKSNRHRLSTTYSNPGVLIINIAKFRKDKIDCEFYKDQIKQMADDDYFYDEGIINFCFWDKRKLLPAYKWQAMVRYIDVWKDIFKLSKEERIANYNEGYHEDFDEEHALSIIHFVPIEKPWDCKFDPLNNAVYTANGDRVKPTLEMFYVEWWNLARSLPLEYYEQILTETINSMYVVPEKNWNRKITNAKNFFERISYDFLGSANLFHYIQMCNAKKFALLKTGDSAGKFFLQMLKQYNVEVVFSTDKNTLSALTDDEWQECKFADVIVCCCVHGTQPIERDGIKPVMISDILTSNTLSSAKYDNFFTYHGMAETILEKIKSLMEDVEGQTDALNFEIIELHNDNDRLNINLKSLNAELNRINIANIKLSDELSKTNAENAKLNAELSRMNTVNNKLSIELRKMNDDNANLNIELGRLNGENKQLIERLNVSDGHSEILSKERDSLNKTVARLENETSRLKNDLNTASVQNNQLNTVISEASSNLEAANKQIQLLNTEKEELIRRVQEDSNAVNELRNKITEMESSNSWRITKPFRSITWFFRRLFGKKEK